jgi:hypothetical protein
MGIRFRVGKKDEAAKSYVCIASSHIFDDIIAEIRNHGDAHFVLRSFLFLVSFTEIFTP